MSDSKYNPREWGAKCDSCLLCERREGDPVKPEWHPGAKVLLVGEHPGDADVKQGRPFFPNSANGRELMKALEGGGLTRKDVVFDNAIACRPPKGKMEPILGEIQRRNRAIRKENIKRLAEGEAPLAEWPSPAECCRPRVMKMMTQGRLENGEVAPFTNIIPVGNATKSFLGPASIQDLRGGMLRGYYEMAQGQARIRVLDDQEVGQIQVEAGADVNIDTVHAGHGKLSFAGHEGSVAVNLLKILPVMHPGAVLNKRRYLPVFRSDLARAASWFRNAIAWKDPEIVLNPSAERLAEFFASKSAFFSYDTETDGIEPLTANLRCIGAANEDGTIGMVTQLLSRDGKTFLTDPKDPVWDVWRKFLTNPDIVKVDWNGAYDVPVIERNLGVLVTPRIDGILLHRLVESELPHRLGFVATYHANAPNWKLDREGRKKAYDAENDQELAIYNAKDVALTSRVFPRLLQSVKLRGQAHLIGVDHKVQELCIGMHSVGMHVSQEKRQWWETTLTRGRVTPEGKTYIGINDHLRSLRAILAATGAMSPSLADKFNPNSVYQLRDIFYDIWKITPPPPPIDENDPRAKVRDDWWMTKNGDPSTSDDVLRSMLLLSNYQLGHGNETLGETIRNFLLRLRRYRKCVKLLGTYVAKLRYSDLLADDGEDEDEDWDEREEREKNGERKLGVVLRATNRFHTGFLAHGTVSGRLSSSKPVNAQNFPAALRNMVVPQPGMCFVGADADQLELRIAAAVWQCNKYLRALDAGADPHAMTAFMCFGDMFKTADGFAKGHWDGDLFIPELGAKWSGKAKNLRTLGKMVQFGSLYGAKTPTVHRLLTETEIERDDGMTDLPFLRMSLKEVREMHERWLDAVPEFTKGWAQAEAEFREHGYVSSKILGRRRDFLDAGPAEDGNYNLSELANTCVQPTAADHINLASAEIQEQIKPNMWGPGTGMFCQVHDWVGVECPEDQAEYVMKIINTAMNRKYEQLPGVTLTAAAEKGYSWDKV